MTVMSLRPGRRAARSALAALVGLVLAGPALAQMPLHQAVRLAAERDPAIEAVRQQVASRNIDIEAAKDEYFPSFSISGDSSTTESDGPGVTLTISQVLWDWGLIRSKIASATFDRVKTVSDLKMAVEDLTLEVAEYYLDVEVLDLKIARTRRYTDFARRIAGQAQDRATAGVSDNGEVARARLEIARAEDQLAQLVADREMTLSQIEFLVGQNPGQTSAPPELGFSAQYSNPAKVVSSVKLAPDYIAARADVDGATAAVETAKASRLPTIKLQAQGRSDLNGGRTRTAVGISAGVDLNSRGFGGRATQAARLELNAAKSSLNASERNLTNKAQTALEQLKILRANEIARDRQLVQAQRVLDNYEQQFIGGQRELIDLLTTGRDLYDVQIDEIDTYDDRKRTEYQAAHDLGVLGTLILASTPTQ